MCFNQRDGARHQSCTVDAVLGRSLLYRYVRNRCTATMRASSHLSPKTSALYAIMNCSAQQYLTCRGRRKGQTTITGELVAKK